MDEEDLRGPRLDYQGAAETFGEAAAYRFAEEDVRLLLWLHAEAVWQRDEALLEVDRANTVWRSIVEQWERSHTNEVLPYTASLETEVDRLKRERADLIAPYVDEEHQGGSWVDVWVHQQKEIHRLRREVEFEANGRTGLALEPPTHDDEQHRALAQGAVEHATRAASPDADGNDLRLTDVVEEAGLAWQMTGLLPSALRDVERDEICRAIAGRVATVLVLVGWEPPARLLAPPQCSVHTDTPERVKPYPQHLFPGCPCMACVPADADPWSFHAQMHLCPHCGNKRCPGAADHRNLCSGSNKPGQPGSLYADVPGVLPEGGGTQ